MCHHIVRRASNVFNPPPLQAWNRSVSLQRKRSFSLRCRTKNISMQLTVFAEKQFKNLILDCKKWCGVEGSSNCLFWAFHMLIQRCGKNNPNLPILFVKTKNLYIFFYVDKIQLPITFKIYWWFHFHGGCFKGQSNEKHVVLLRKPDAQARYGHRAFCAMSLIFERIALALFKCFIGKLINKLRFIKLGQDSDASDDFNIDEEHFLTSDFCLLNACAFHVGESPRWLEGQLH